MPFEKSDDPKARPDGKDGKSKRSFVLSPEARDLMADRLDARQLQPIHIFLRENPGSTLEVADEFDAEEKFGTLLLRGNEISVRVGNSIFSVVLNPGRFRLTPGSAEMIVARAAKREIYSTIEQSRDGVLLKIFEPPELFIKYVRQFEEGLCSIMNRISRAYVVTVNKHRIACINYGCDAHESMQLRELAEKGRLSARECKGETIVKLRKALLDKTIREQLKKVGYTGNDYLPATITLQESNIKFCPLVQDKEK